MTAQILKSGGSVDILLPKTDIAGTPPIDISIDPSGYNRLLVSGALYRSTTGGILLGRFYINRTLTAGLYNYTLIQHSSTGLAPSAATSADFWTMNAGIEGAISQFRSGAFQLEIVLNSALGFYTVFGRGMCRTGATTFSNHFLGGDIAYSDPITSISISHSTGTAFSTGAWIEIHGYK